MDSLKCTKGDNAGQLNEKHFYDPYQHREVKHPTSWVHLENRLYMTYVVRAHGE